ncbi:MAG: CPBP family intramembrane metalloprotease [Asgard group archaeon]|nr:CPBP family intramembrane metalloprotease [Asgard group archaeon]
MLNENNQYEVINEIELIETHEDQKIESKHILLFFVFAFLWTWLLYLPRVLATYDYINLPDWSGLIFGGFATFGPTISAIIVIGIINGSKGIKDLLKKGIKTDFKKIWLIPIFLLLPLTAGIAFGISILIFGFTIGDGYYNWALVINVVFIAFFIGGPLGEEFGWRGFILDPLQNKFGSLGASLLLGFIWGVWHLPLHFIADTTQQFIPIWAFVLLQMVMSILYTWLYNNTKGSVLVAILFHWISNIAGALIPFWQIGFINSQEPNNLYLPTYGMLIGFAITLLTASIITVLFGSKRMIK